ncbi:phosphatase PAP2 family protein [Elizabethkingia meningoseptica]|uniref:hypothetical protein n=2 Tax=Elizabethkingia meningoseptica TaxID=238 RepID=UPI00389158B8
MKKSMIEKLSSFISNLFNPIFSFLFFLLYYAFSTMENQEAWLLIGKAILIFALPILGYIYYNVRKGKFTNMDVSNRKQRNSLYYYIIALLFLFIIGSFIAKTAVPHAFYYLTGLLCAMMLSNFWIKSSMHTALNFFVAALFYQLSPVLGFIWGIHTVIIAITRLILKRHTVSEVLAGATLGIIFSLAFVYWN